MLLTSAHVTLFKSIEDSGDVPIDPYVTVLVGQNESGKTAFLQALHKAVSTDPTVTYVVVDDYPRRTMTTYQRSHPTNPATVAVLTYGLQGNDIAAINDAYGFALLRELSFSLTHTYANTRSITLSVLEKPYLDHILSETTLSADAAKVAEKASSVRKLITSLKALDLNAIDSAFVEEVETRFKDAIATTWDNVLAQQIWAKHLSPKTPRFLYFDDYYLLPGKVNLNQLQQREANKTLLDEDKTVMSLLRLANVTLQLLRTEGGYEQVRAQLEGISNTITDSIFEYWTQNKNLRVVIDVRSDPEDEPPYNDGNNLYIRIENLRHRVSVPFSQRSKGFIWFFSFLVWFDSVQEELGNNADLVLLLDEPGLSLHALGQADLLRYIDTLAKTHQVVYTTHSPFMVKSDRLDQARTVEDKETTGTRITQNVSSVTADTLFPLQAALGYTIAQNLFIAKQNLLVEGPADLIYLQFYSNALEALGRTSLRDELVIVPTGGLDKVATFIALLGANDLEIAVLHDYSGIPDRRIESLVHEKIIEEKKILTYSMFRSGNKQKTNLIPSDVEDLITPSAYLRLFNATYKQDLNGMVVGESDLPLGDRIVRRIEDYLKANSVQLRPSGGFSHYRIANHLASNPSSIGKHDAKSLDRFEEVIKAVNALYT